MALDTPQKLVAKPPAGGGYGAFIAERRAELSEQCKRSGSVSFVKLAAAEWKKLPASQKEVYAQRFREAKAKHAASTTSGAKGGKQSHAESGRKAPEESQRPKKPVSGGWGIFFSARRPELAKLCSGKSGKHLIELAAAEWAKLSAEEKEPYAKSFREAQAKYAEDMAAFVAAGGHEKCSRGASAAAKRKSVDKERAGPQLPKRPVGGAYSVFFSENLKRIREALPPGSGAHLLSKEAAKQWRALPAEERKPFEDMHRKRVEAFEREVSELRGKSGPGAEACPQTPPTKKSRCDA